MANGEREQRTYTIDEIDRRGLIAAMIKRYGENMMSPSAALPDSVVFHTHGVPGEQLMAVADNYDLPIKIGALSAHVTHVMYPDNGLGFTMEQTLYSSDLSEQHRRLYAAHNENCLADPAATQPTPPALTDTDTNRGYL